MYPLRFEPIFQRYIWGGLRLKDVLNKQTGDESCAESWEIVDHNKFQSLVKYGLEAGQTLGELVKRHGADLLGKSAFARINSQKMPTSLRGRFPLLLKFLDANRNLSVQVHPDDEMGARLDTPDLGKTEAWYVIDTKPGAKIFAGLKPGVSKKQFVAAIEAGTTEALLHSFQPKIGDCVFIPAGTMHAIGEGLLIAEIQQASNTTFRVFDWNRVDKNGQPRQLHIEDSLAATNFDSGPVNPNQAIKIEDRACELVRCRDFVMNRWQLSAEQVSFADARMRIITVIKGALQIESDSSGQPLTKGETVLIPACLPSTTVSAETGAEFLDIFLPY